ncbi:MAG: tRNA (adenosine(37)-N6)-threonylcarbamoyltransferase complex ATPase subunit type 1 TsaE [Bifidobacteriaceae bacterium]|jgi:tRNA threonylcarbamoyladenosine biosynthesis protein TsaE|nr:tRNA (adenosine(37)-N6)-threonylcarbamoyltransferase complex ATPase subunit type 1 TsaE [Bifidobacteriaceae bacterium]
MGLLFTSGLPGSSDGTSGPAGMADAAELALPQTLQLPTAQDTRALGRNLARFLGPGDLVLLSGGLGAGKTTLTQGLGEGLRVRGPVSSPTFIIARVHPALGSGPALVHVDAYRLGGLSDREGLAQLDDLDLDAALEDSVTVVEWGEGLAERLAQDRLEIQLERHRGGTGAPNSSSNSSGPRGPSGSDTTNGAPHYTSSVGLGLETDPPDPTELRVARLRGVGARWGQTEGIR